MKCSKKKTVIKRVKKTVELGGEKHPTVGRFKLKTNDKIDTQVQKSMSTTIKPSEIIYIFIGIWKMLRLRGLNFAFAILF